MSITNFPPRLFFFLSLTILSVLAQEILIDHLKSQDSTSDGEIKTVINPNNPEQINGVSLFGWIRIVSPQNSGYIFALCQEACPNSDPDNAGGFLFFLQFVSWETSTLRFSVVKNQEELSQTNMTLQPNELNSWLFVYIGHSFVHSRQSYYKYSPSNISRIIINEINIKPEQNSNIQYRLITGFSQFQSRYFFIGEIQRLTIQFGELVYKENNFLHLHTLHPDQLSLANCSFFFSECAYIGSALNVCETTSNHPMKTIKSVLYQNEQQDFICFRGKKIIVRKNIECITDENYLDLYSSGSITIESFHNKECLE